MMKGSNAAASAAAKKGAPSAGGVVAGSQRKENKEKLNGSVPEKVDTPLWAFFFRKPWNDGYAPYNKEQQKEPFAISLISLA